MKRHSILEQVNLNCGHYFHCMTQNVFDRMNRIFRIYPSNNILFNPAILSQNCFFPFNDRHHNGYTISQTALAAAFIALSLTCPTRASAPAPAGWTLVWSDEFDGSRIDSAKWDFDFGNGFFSYDANQWIGGWGNGELEY